MIVITADIDQFTTLRIFGGQYNSRLPSIDIFNGIYRHNYIVKELFNLSELFLVNFNIFWEQSTQRDTQLEVVSNIRNFRKLKYIFCTKYAYMRGNEIFYQCELEKLLLNHHN